MANAYGEMLSESDEIVTSILGASFEYSAMAIVRDRRGIVLKALPATEDGRIDLGKLRRSSPKRPG